MPLSSDLISQFVKLTNDKKETTKSQSIYGTVVESDGTKWVRLDGSPSGMLTPVDTTTDIEDGDRVIVDIKDHTAIITGNVTTPSINKESSVDNGNGTSTKISELGIIVADKVSTKELKAETARIDTLEANNAVINGKISANEASIGEIRAGVVTVEGELSAAKATINTLNTDVVTINEELTATNAKIETLEATDADFRTVEADYADFKTATISNLEANNASITNLDTKKLDAESAKLTYANIDFSNIGTAAIEKFYSTSGIIKDLVLSEGTVTGKLVGVTIVGDLIEGGTVKADKLVVLGEDGLYYKLNVNSLGETTAKSDPKYQNGLDGSVIIAESITAEKINVDDLVAFDATIGGFNITENALYSGAKSSVSDTTNRGIYLDNEGQFVVGDDSNYFKYYRDQNGNYKLEISAKSIRMSTTNKTVEDSITNIQNDINNISIGGRNYVLNSSEQKDINYYHTIDDTGYYDVYMGISDEMRKLNSDITDFMVSYDAYSDNAISVIDIYLCNDDSINLTSSTPVLRYTTTTWQRFSSVITLNSDYTISDITRLCVRIYASENDSIHLKNIKVEIGNKPTDWTPAPEDMATSEKVNDAISAVEDKTNNNQSLIEELTSTISTLVVDNNGESLMVNDGSGWTFSTAKIQNMIDTTSDNLDALTNEVGDVNSTVGILQQAVDDLGILSDYVKITTYEDEPCVELGETDSDFKLLITNTRILFMEGSSMPAYVTNKSLHINKAVIEEELQQGEFVWKIRSNGNMGLVWKGASS